MNQRNPTDSNRDDDEPHSGDVPMPPDDPGRQPPVKEPPQKDPPKRAT